MSGRRRRLWRWISLVVLAALAGGAFYIYRLSLLGAAYHAKTLCSGVFVSGRDPAAVQQVDITDGVHPLLRLITAQIDDTHRSVTAGMFGLPQRVAVYRDGLGCTLAIGVSAAELRAQPALPKAPPLSPDRPWPEGEAVPLNGLPREFDHAALRMAVEGAFDVPEPARSRRTRAVVVVYDGRIVAERYAPGFSADTPLLGWSMTKTVTNALVGTLVRDGKLALDQPAPVPEWQQPGDARAAITIEQLLRMTSGLSFSERYEEPFSDVVTMLLGTPNMAAYAAGLPLAATPGSTWSYSTGTSNVLARVAQGAAGDTPEARLSFARRALFDRIGMTSAVLEVDAAGNYVGSSYVYATARDWARFGLLYLNDGVWHGERILPRGWVQASLRTTPGARHGFGAHVWRQVPDPFYRTDGPRPTLPEDAFHMAGHEGQLVTVIPSRKLVIVRLGLTRKPEVWDHEEFVVQVLRAFPPA